MERDLFNDYIQQGLAFEQSYGSGGFPALKKKEGIAWSLYESGSAAGGMLLGDSLLTTRVSYLRRDLKVVPFARTVVDESFQALNEIEEKGEWDCYYLGIAHEFGRGTKVDHKLASEFFQKAKELGNPYGEFEAIWSGFLSDKAIYNAVSRFRSCEGKLACFAAASAQSLSLLALGPARDIGSYPHAWRIIEISQYLHQFLYHDAGSRHINITVEAELRGDVGVLESLNTAAAAFVLYLIASGSRRNPTSEDSNHWLRLAVVPNCIEFVSLAKGRNLSGEELKLILDVCDSNEWCDSEVARFAASEIELLEMDADDYDA